MDLGALAGRGSISAISYAVSPSTCSSKRGGYIGHTDSLTKRGKNSLSGFEPPAKPLMPSHRRTGLTRADGREQLDLLTLRLRQKPHDGTFKLPIFTDFKIAPPSAKEEGGVALPKPQPSAGLLLNQKQLLSIPGITSSANTATLEVPAFEQVSTDRATAHAIACLRDLRNALIKSAVHPAGEVELYQSSPAHDLLVSLRKDNPDELNLNALMPWLGQLHNQIHAESNELRKRITELELAHPIRTSRDDEIGRLGSRVGQLDGLVTVLGVATQELADLLPLRLNQVVVIRRFEDAVLPASTLEPSLVKNGHA